MVKKRRIIIADFNALVHEEHDLAQQRHKTRPFELYQNDIARYEHLEALSDYDEAREMLEILGRLNAWLDWQP